MDFVNKLKMKCTISAFPPWAPILRHAWSRDDFFNSGNKKMFEVDRTSHGPPAQRQQTAGGGQIQFAPVLVNTFFWNLAIGIVHGNFPAT